MHSLVPQTLHVKDKTLNSSSLQNRSPSFSLSRWLLQFFFFFFSFLFLFSLQVATPMTITNVKTHSTRTNSKMDFIYRFTKPMRSNPKMDKENPKKQVCWWVWPEKKRRICKNHEDLLGTLATCFIRSLGL